MEMEQSNNMTINKMSASTWAIPGGGWVCRKCGKINDPEENDARSLDFHRVPVSKESDH